MKARRAAILLLIVAGSVGVALLAERYGGLTGVQSLELAFLDWRQVDARAPTMSPEEADVVLVLFDEAATAEWPYLSPYPRTVLADLVRQISAAGPRTIGVDVFLERLYPQLGGDDALRQAMEEAGNVVLAAPVDKESDPPRLVYPHPTFTEAAADVGSAEFPAAFETIRDGTLLVWGGDRPEPGFALALYAQALGLDADSLVDAAMRSGRLDLPGLPPGAAELPPSWLEGDPAEDEVVMHFPLRFVGPPSGTEAVRGSFPAYPSSYAGVMATFTPELFRDRIVLLGSGFHDSDKFRSPFWGQPVPASAVDPDQAGAVPEDLTYLWTYGVEVHANALQGMLDGAYVRRLGTAWKIVMLSLFAALASAFAFRWGGIGGGAASLGLTLVPVAVGFWAFSGEVYLPAVGTVFELGAPLLWVPVVTPLVAILFSYLSTTAYVQVVEGREKRFIKGAFGKYVSPAVVSRISQDPASLQLGGQRRSLSVLFSDLAGFTTLSEKSGPEELVALLNEYLTEMTSLVLEDGGTLDKYIGDAVMAFWNAPTDVPDHADRAMLCAIRMQRKMTDLNERWTAEDRIEEPLRVRIGVNTGDVIVGNVGGKDRFDYSCIGDPVNLAARLEPANKTYGTLTMASEFTVAAAHEGRYRLRELDRVAVKGKSRPVTVYEVVETADRPLPPEREELLDLYGQGLDAYQRRDWEMARQYFAAALEIDPDDGPSRVYLERAEEYADEPPPADWDFVVRRTTK